ncbi:DinB family protein [Paenibacillus filicis]|uniref:DinB family protein n=1 Tax=Paenibacillus gyeongsangnamensis TaxID=3388067 RepID=A0ABT4QLF1_9BACL|nr:DinB family protein [Paenibacillus filicis]MCZ8517670.1 DinB family protein [Paenibacillus filicis]
MNHLVFKQFELTRGFFIGTVESIPEEIIDVKPEGFNNTIHWHIGHVLTITEGVISYPHKSTIHLPENYIELFDTGTRPTEWKGDIPSVDKLILQLKDQLVRLQQIPSGKINERLDNPFNGLETFGEFASLVLLHEGIHLGQISIMKRMIEYVK